MTEIIRQIAISLLISWFKMNIKGIENKLKQYELKLEAKNANINVLNSKLKKTRRHDDEK